MIKNSLLFEYESEPEFKVGFTQIFGKETE
jgi:hypothetical protein